MTLIGRINRIIKLHTATHTPQGNSLAELLLEAANAREENGGKEVRKDPLLPAWRYLDQSNRLKPANVKDSRYSLHVAGMMKGFEVIFPMEAVPDLIQAARKSSWKGKEYELLLQAFIPFTPGDKAEIEKAKQQVSQIYPKQLPAYAKLPIETEIMGEWAISSFQIKENGYHDILKIYIPMTEKRAIFLMEKHHAEKIRER
jgi:hypothetical protein